MNHSPFKRALRNSLLITFLVGLTVHLQGTTVAASIMTMIYSLLLIFPLLWGSYHYLHKIRSKYETETEVTPPATEQTAETVAPTAESSVQVDSQATSQNKAEIIAEPSEKSSTP